jgi:hypothetical protein
MLDCGMPRTKVLAEYSIYIPRVGKEAATGQIENETGDDWRRVLCDGIDKLYCEYGNWAEIRLVLPPINQ